MTKLKSNAMTFKRGRQKTGGRKLGVPHKSTKVLRDAILLAAEAIDDEKGGDGLVLFIKWAAKKHTPNFLAFFARLISQQFETKQTSHK